MDDDGFAAGFLGRGGVLNGARVPRIPTTTPGRVVHQFHILVVIVGVVDRGA